MKSATLSNGFSAWANKQEKSWGVSAAGKSDNMWQGI